MASGDRATGRPRVDEVGDAALSPALAARPGERRSSSSSSAHSIDPAGGFFVARRSRAVPIERSAATGKPPAREIHVTTRMVHCFAIARLMGRPGAEALHRSRHGVPVERPPRHDEWRLFLGRRRRRAERSDRSRPTATPSCCSPRRAPRWPAIPTPTACSPMSARCCARASGRARTARSAEEFAADWTPISHYRGQNSNMHLTEALMAAFEATGDNAYLEMAESIASLIIGKGAAENGWRVAGAFQRELGARPRLFGRRRLPARRHDARPFARMDAALPAALGARRPPPRLAARRGQGALRARRRGRLGRGATAASTTRSTGTASRCSGTGSGGRARKGSAPRIS